jgi:protein phosphatase
VRYLGKTGDASLAETDFIFAVSDGMGGAKSGEFASRSAIDRITKLLPRHVRRDEDPASAALILSELVKSVHVDLLKLGASYEECSGMGATLTLAWLTPSWLHFAHVGDSRLYHLPAAAGLQQLTHDHTHVGWLRRQGKLNEREARSHPLRNALHQALGAGHQFVEPQVGSENYQPDDRYVLCTDGVTDGLWDRQLEEIVRTPPPERAGESPAKCVVEEAVAAFRPRQRHGRDLRNHRAGRGHEIHRAAAHFRLRHAQTRVLESPLSRRAGIRWRSPHRARLPALRTAWFSGMVPRADDQDGVVGEVWSVDAAALVRLDALEGVAEGMYRREPVPLEPPFSGQDIEGYLYNRNVEGRRDLGGRWDEIR